MKIETTLSRRRLLASVPAVAAAGVPAAAAALGGLATGTTADPIFAAIAEHKAAVEARVTAMRTLFPDGQDIDPDHPEYEEAEECENEAREALLTTPLTTVAGVAAWLKHMGSAESEEKHSAVLLFSIIAYTRPHLSHLAERQLLAAAAVLEEIA
jgi:hypothetical protein